MINMKLAVSHDRNDESPEAKARWFQSLSLAERMEYLCNVTDLALKAHPELANEKDVRPAQSRVQVLTLSDVRQLEGETAGDD